MIQQFLKIRLLVSKLEKSSINLCKLLSKLLGPSLHEISRGHDSIIDKSLCVYYLLPGDACGTVQDVP